MTIFKIQYEECSFYQDRHNCARCYVKDNELHQRCMKRKSERMTNKAFSAFMKEIDPYPWIEAEFQAQGENRLDCSEKFARFAALSMKAYDFLWMLEKDMKSKALSIMKEKHDQGYTPCQAIVYTYEKMKQMLHNF